MISVNGDYNGNGYTDLAVGIPGANIDLEFQAGVVQLFYGFFAACLNSEGNRYWYQGLLGATDGSEVVDNFGAALG